MDVTRTVAPATLGEQARAIAALVRLPNVFTAPPDVVAGAALATVAGGTVATAPGDAGTTATAGGTVAVPELAGLAAASATIYAAGTTLNDYFDADVDAVERPERPIPSGRVSRTGALGLGVVLLAVGVALAFASAGVAGGAVAAVLAAVVVAYDGLAKGTPVGYGLMGATRGLNVLLGTTVGGTSTVAAMGTPPILAVPAVVTLYVAGVTWMAADEAQGGDRTAVATVGGLAVLAALVPPVLAATSSTGPVRPAAATLLSLAFLGFVGRALVAAYRDPSPAVVGPTVGRCVLGLVILAAAVAAVAGVAWAVAALAFLVPATGLARVFDVS